MVVGKTMKLIASILLISIAIAASIGQLSLAQTTTTTTTPKQSTTNVNASNVTYQVFLAKALVLREMLSRVQALNISSELKSEISALLAINISKLPLDELKEWIYNASKVLSDVHKEIVVGGRAYAVEIVLERYINGLKIAIENRVKHIEKKYNITIPVESIVANITKAKNIREVNKALKELEKEMERERVKKFANIVLNATAKELAKGVPKGIEEAYKHLNIVINILNQTVKKLEKANVSKDIIASLNIAIEKVIEARNIVVNISKRITIEKPVNISAVVSKVVKNKTEEALEELEELEEELENLRNVSISTNITTKINELLQRIEELKKKIANASIEDLSRWMPDLAEIKAWIKAIRDEYKELPKSLPAANVDKAYNVTIGKAEKLLEKVKQMLSYIRNMTKDLKYCIMIYPPPPVCKVLEPAFINWVNNSIKTAEDLITTAKQQYEAGNKITALILANKAYSILKIVEGQLKPIYELLLKSKSAQQISTQTQKPLLEVKEARIERKGLTSVLILKVKNNGNVDVKITSITIMLKPKPVSIQKEVTISAGAEQTISIQLSIPIIEKTVDIVITTSSGETIASSAEVE
ncbi:hypothetical protein QPL79_02400 [Ignisphaera sp. 4213-co]|uniref:CARDB domain-containing protein n=1 Tax=Ignisphaera cupida TaxID=3050454 RepID=A0ABD4Z4H6_9CREN|nr:hypothetical protein [Ignisphaera sp. 4213-co]MDK6028216.1 hypothetical protein [Ignisphaera sp. 4213-co]